MESSVRTARVAVYELLNINKQVPDINPLQYDIRHLLKATKALNDNKHIMGESILQKMLKGTYFEHVLPVGESEEEEANEHFLTEQLGNLQDWIKSLKK